VQHDRDQLHAVALGRGGQTIARLRGVARLEPRRAVVKPHELVCVGQSELSVPYGVHPDGRVLSDLVVPQKLARHERDVVGGREMLRRIRLVVEARAVDKVRVGHAELGRALVHELHKRALAARDMLGQRGRAVVGRGHHDRFEHVPERHLLVFLEIDLASSLGRGGRRGRHFVVPAYFTLIQRLHDEQQRHDLRDARGRQLLMVVLLIEQRPRRGVHQNSRGRRDLRAGRQRRNSRAQEQSQCKAEAQKAFKHKKSPFRFIWYKHMKRKGVL